MKTKMKRKYTAVEKRENRQLYLLMLPVFILIAVFCYAPMFGIVIAFSPIIFKTWKIIVRHLVLALLAIIWLIPIVWLVVTSLSTTKGVSYQHFFPEHWTLANYHQLFFKTDTAANFPAWFKNAMFAVALELVSR